jgi:uncharacterized protein YegL
MKRLARSLLFIIVLLLATLGASRAFFSDQETSEGNILAAGAIDLKIDNTCYYNGVATDNCTWGLDDLTDQLFFNFLDIKPSDWEEDTISVHVEDNDAWACMNITLTKNDDNTCTEPELLDDPTCSENDDENDGELAQTVEFVFWGDDGDNVLETDETDIVFKEGTALELFDGSTWRLADSSGNIWDEFNNPLVGGEDYFIGKAWCFGELTLAPIAPGNNSPTANPGILCDGSALNNATQSDIMMADISFSAVQARHNAGFLCGENGEEPCFTKADVMLVLDRSGSINSTELGELKTAAKAFVDALALSADGAHAGEVSFATTASLDAHLTDNGAVVKAVIDALASGGFTNLKDAIDLAAGELENPGDGHDRSDVDSPDIIVIITDGNPNRPEAATAAAEAVAAATAAKAAGATIYVVGVGNDVDTAYLRDEIATSPAHYFEAADFASLSEELEDIAACPNGD